MDNGYVPRSPDISNLHYNTTNDAPPSPSQAFYTQRAPPPLTPSTSTFLPDPELKAEYSHQDLQFDFDTAPVEPLQPMPTTSKRGRRKAPATMPQSTSTNALPPLDSITIRTKFPVARIKRIVQADEDVGKVAQVTPVIISKALELFMISLALQSGAEARVRGSKRVTGAHLKAAVAKSEQFDFLRDIVGKLPDVVERTAAAVKKSEESDEEEEEVKPKVRRKDVAIPGRRKKRKQDSDED